MEYVMELKEFIRAEAGAIDQVMRADVDSISKNLDPLLTEVLDYGLFCGGKRIRPLLALLCARLCGCRSSEIYRMAVAFEYLHTATLFHDDVIDQAKTRRGRESVNSRYGTVAAILAGDFLHTHAIACISERVGQKGVALFSRATRGMVDGEFVQLRNATDFNQSEKDYFAVVFGKTALLIGATCEIGALYGGGDQAQQDGLKAYGLKLGCSFQIVDDILDYLGDQQATGKSVGNDLVEGKMTLPLIHAIDQATPADKRRFLQILELAPERRGEHFTEICQLIDRYQGFEKAREKAATIVDEALAVLAGGQFPHSAERALLEELSQYVLKRNK